jgi:hypothetical protein
MEIFPFNDFSNKDHPLSQNSQYINAGHVLPSSILTNHPLPFQLAIFIPEELLQPSGGMKIKMPSLRH